MAGLTLFETDNLTVLAQQNAANAPFSFPGGTRTISTPSRTRGQRLSPDGSTLYQPSIFPRCRTLRRAPMSGRFLLNDPDNLLITLGLQLPENLAGKMVISPDGQTVSRCRNRAL